MNDTKKKSERGRERQRLHGRGKGRHEGALQGAECKLTATDEKAIAALVKKAVS